MRIRQNKYLRITFWSVVVLAILFAVYIRNFHHLYSTPGWFADEGVNLNIANNLLHGKVQAFSSKSSFVPHPPLFFMISTLAIAILGKSILSIRVVSSLAGIASIIATYFLAKEITKSQKIALVATIAAFTYPAAIISSRLGLTYSFFVPLAITCTFFFIRFYKDHKASSLVWASLLASLATITTPLGAIFLITALYTAIKYHALKFRTILVCLLPVVLYVSFASLNNYPIFFKDLAFLISRVGKNSGVTAPHVGLTTMVGDTIGESVFAIMGFIGLFTLQNKFRFIIPMAFIVCVAFELLTKGTLSFGSGTYFGIIFFPIGFASLFSDLNCLILKFKKSITVITVFYIAFILILAVPFVKTMIKIVDGGFIGTQQEDWFSFNNIGVAEEAAGYINTRTEPTSLVMASPQMASLLQARTFDPMQSLSFTGVPTLYYPADFRSQERFTYSASYLDADYIVVDKMVKNWFAFQDNVRIEILEKFWNSWPRVFSQDEIIIFRNPYK